MKTKLFNKLDLRKTSPDPGSTSANSGDIFSAGGDTVVPSTAEKCLLDGDSRLGAAGILRKSSITGLICLLVLIIGASFSPLVSATQTASASRVAPGELMPISAKLSNFGNAKRVDVLVKYSIITSDDDEIYSTSETVAVETTASFIKTVQVPADTKPGIYTAQTSATYPGQQTPATTHFLFTVEQKIFGVFQSDFILYGGATVIISVLLVILGHTLVGRRTVRFTPFDYSNIPHDVRTFYEILSDTIMQMRGRVGEDAFLIAANIDGLTINKNTGRVLSMTGSPAKIIAALVTEYEKRLGKRVSFSLRR